MKLTILGMVLCALAYVILTSPRWNRRPAPAPRVVVAERARPVAHLYAYGKGGTGLWMHGKLPDSSQWKPGDTLWLLTDEARFDE